MNLVYIDHMGSDDFVVNAARVSFAKEASAYSPQQNDRLIRFLAKHKHWSPFAHPQVHFRVTVPVFIARQWFKHIVGSVKNEESRRYVSDEPSFHRPVWRKAPEKSVKQGSGEEFREFERGFFDESFDAAVALCMQTYRKLLADGVCPEHARSVLPQAMLTSFVDTGSLYYWSRVYNQRTDPHAQREWAPLMAVLDAEMERLFPISWVELTRKGATGG